MESCLITYENDTRVRRGVSSEEHQTRRAQRAPMTPPPPGRGQASSRASERGAGVSRARRGEAGAAAVGSPVSTRVVRRLKTPSPQARATPHPVDAAPCAEEGNRCAVLVLGPRVSSLGQFPPAGGRPRLPSAVFSVHPWNTSLCHHPRSPRPTPVISLRLIRRVCIRHLLCGLTYRYIYTYLIMSF